MQEYCIKISSNICFGYLLELTQQGNSNKYPKHMFYEEIRIKQGLSFKTICPLRILYNREFILMATALGTNAVVVVVMRVSCRKKHTGCNLKTNKLLDPITANHYNCHLLVILKSFFFLQTVWTQIKLLL